MPITVFYAWQSDRDATVCRFMIRDAVKLAVKKLNADAAVKSAPPFELDHDTKGTTGHQHIASVIRKKIRQCGVFVADLTHVTEYQTADDPPRAKRAQNPNVLIELGIAIRAKGFGRLLLVMNDAFGPVDDLPFDLKSHSFPIIYTLSAGANKSTIKAAKESLAKSIADKLKPMLIAIHEDAAAKLKAKEADERKVKVTCLMAMAGTPGGAILKFLSITAVNLGTRPVTVTQAAILLTDGSVLVPVRSQTLGFWKLPKRLEESDEVSVMADVEPLYQAVVKGRQDGKPSQLKLAFVKDTTGNVYASDELDKFTEADLKPI